MERACVWAGSCAIAGVRGELNRIHVHMRATETYRRHYTLVAGAHVVFALSHWTICRLW